MVNALGSTPLKTTLYLNVKSNLKSNFDLVVKNLN